MTLEKYKELKKEDTLPWPDVNSPVLIVIKVGETFSVFVYPKEGDGNWYEVYRNNQTGYGYIHKSRVKRK